MFKIDSVHEFRSTAPVWLLGTCYKHLSQNLQQHAQHSTDQSNYNQHLNTILWLTYRRNMHCNLLHTAVNTDAGWGCMLRSGQMMLARALYLHLIQRSNTPHYAEKYAQLIHWFLDCDDAVQHPFALHSILQHATAADNNDVVGQWYSPGATWKMLQKCLNAFTIPNLAIYVADDNTLYRDKITELCTVSQPRSWAHNQADARYHNFAEPVEHTGAWRACLIVIPVRLGSDTLNTDYIPSLLSCLQYSQSLGFVGGKPRASLYFIGVHDSSVLYLDPHTVQHATSTDDNLCDTAVQASYHCDTVSSVLGAQLDPSVAIGFYCRDRTDFDAFWQQAKFRSECTSHAVFHVADKQVVYTYEHADCDESTDNTAEHTVHVTTHTTSSEPTHAASSTATSTSAAAQPRKQSLISERAALSSNNALSDTVDSSAFDEDNNDSIFDDDEFVML